MIVDFEDLNNLFVECSIDFTKKLFSINQCHNLIWKFLILW